VERRRQLQLKKVFSFPINMTDDDGTIDYNEMNAVLMSQVESLQQKIGNFT
jgi:hypothetical protein